MTKLFGTKDSTTPHVITRDKRFEQHEDPLLQVARSVLHPNDLIKGKIREMVASGALPANQLEALSEHLFVKSQDFDLRNIFSKRPEHLRKVAAMLNSVAFDLVMAGHKAS